MKMSSNGTSIVCKKDVSNNNEAYISSSEPNDSLFLSQSETISPKIFSKEKYINNRKSIRYQKLKDMRKGGNSRDVPKKPKNVKYVHQSLAQALYPSSLIDTFKQQFLLDSEPNVPRLLEVLEVVGALAITLPALKTPSQIIAQIVLSVRALTQGSLIEQIVYQDDVTNWCKQVFGFNIFVKQSDGEVIDDQNPSVSWLRSIPHLRENWEALRHAPVFSRISALISVAASIGLCSVANLKWSYQGVDLFRVGTISKHHTALDLVGAVIDTVVCFIEGGYECFKQRSFRPLFFSNRDGEEFDALYFLLLELHEHAMVFNLHTKIVTVKNERRTVSDLEYGSLLDEALELSERFYKSAKGTWQQGYLERRCEVLRKNRAAYQAKRIDGSMRFAPFCVYIWGPSGVGKSTLAQVIMADCLSASGVDPSNKNTAVIKESDKYDSTLKGHTTGIFFDDMGNTKSEFMDKSPTERMIDICNNMITYANKADLHEKGKIEIRPRVFVVTSNAPLVEHAQAGSVCPYSVVRRADVHILAKVKETYALEDGRLNATKALDDFPDGSLVNDLWDLQLYTPCDSSENRLMVANVDSEFDPKPRSIDDTLRYLTTKCIKHFENQRKLITKGEGLVASRKYCAECKLAHTLCECVPIPVEEESEHQALCQDTFEFIRVQFDAMGDKFSNFLGFLPTYLFSNKIVLYLYMFFNVRSFLAFERSVRRILLSTLLFCMISFSYCDCFRFSSTFVLSAYHILLYLGLLAKWRFDRLNDLLTRRDITMELFASIRKSKAFLLVNTCIAASLLYKLVKFYKTSRGVMQSALAPDSVEEIQVRDSEVNPWATAVVEELHVSNKSATMTYEQVLQKISTNLCHGVFVENDFQQKCDLLALGGNIFLMPMHVFANRKDLRAMVTRKDPNLLNSTFRAVISVEHIMPIEGKDLCLVYIASGGIFSDIRHLFPDSITASGSGHFLYRNADGSLNSDDIRITYTKNSLSGGPGYDYTLPYNTFTGLCMGVVVAKFAKTCVAGVHLRGIPNTPTGKALIVTRTEILHAWDKAQAKWIGAFPSVVNGTFPKERYEKQVLSSFDIHVKSPINFMPLGSNVEFLGQDGKRISHTKSKVRQTPISDIVTRVTGVSNSFGPPKFHRYKMWQASLAHSANPSPGIEGSLLTKAYTDYVEGFIEVIKAEQFRSWTYSELHPLSEMETLCGVDGKRFIDAMPKGTSKGYPLSGPKRDMIELLDPLDYPGFQCPASAHPMVLEEISRMEECLLNGERCYSIFKACVKDEPTKVDKDKVRVFQAADWATQMMIRKYYLPIARIISLFPLVSECAVGVNAQGPEWDQLAKYMSKHGVERILAGDYSKYDLRMPAQLINAAFAALIEIARRCGNYTERDIIVMRGLATEVAYSCVAYNGDIIIHKGSNPSGQNLTVYINCIVNSLQLRCAYFHLWPVSSGKPLPFRDVCSIMTYGDDVKGSVKEGYDWFNHISYAAFLKARDMVFTMPDKESEPTTYMNDNEADFLKRHNIYNVDTGLIHGALDEESIFKSLHTVLESKVVSLEDQSAGNIDGALREWWQHGKKVYELRREQMKKVAFEAGLTPACKMLTESYEDRLKHFRTRYLGEDDEIGEGSSQEDTFVSVVGGDWDLTE
jgi:hypothetical protein